MANNINDLSTNLCTGCGVCSVICPNNAIDICINSEGFLMALVKEDLCIRCGLCKKVCFKYVHNENIQYRNSPMRKSNIYAAYSKDTITRMSCSSGGVGYEIAKKYLEMGYKICGAQYNYEQKRVEHIILNDFNQLDTIKGSKYLQSYTRNAFSKFNKDERYVVFGTPCQIYGLKQLIKLNKIENNFILIDLFCLGVPSYNLWNKYLNGLRKIGVVTNINFRDKSKGWHNYSIQIAGDKESYVINRKADIFYKFFESRRCFNKSCYKCLFRKDIIFSDLRLGDFWGAKYLHDEKGVSIVVSNTEKGNGVVANLNNEIFFEPATYNDLLRSQRIRFIAIPKEYQLVMGLLKTKIPLFVIDRLVNQIMKT